MKMCEGWAQRRRYMAGLGRGSRCDIWKFEDGPNLDGSGRLVKTLLDTTSLITRTVL